MCPSKTLPRASAAPPMIRDVEAEVRVGTGVGGKADETGVGVKEGVEVGVEVEVEKEKNRSRSRNKSRSARTIGREGRSIGENVGIRERVGMGVGRKTGDAAVGVHGAVGVRVEVEVEGGIGVM